MKTAVESIRNTPLPQKPVNTAAVTAPLHPTPATVPPAPGTMQNPAHSTYAPLPKSHAPIGTIIAASCALVAVGIVVWKEFSKPDHPNPSATPAPVIAAGTPEPVKIDPEPPSTPAVAVATPVPSTPVPATPAPIAMVTPPPHEPVAPVATPPPDRPVAVQQVNIPSYTPRVTSLVPVATPVPMTNNVYVPPEPEPAASDWAALVASGDNLMRRRQTDEAIDAYSQAIEIAQSNPKNVSATEYGQVCLKLGSLQIQTGATAEAKRTLIDGRAFLLRTNGPASVREQIEGMLRKLPRD
jgi:hypothetical protein